MELRNVLRLAVAKLRAMLFVRSQHATLIEVRISRDQLIKNFAAFSALYPSARIAPVLKSNAYGHGITDVARILDKCDAPFFCIDSLYEADVLAGLGLKTPLVIIGYVPPADIVENASRQLSFSILGIEQLRDLSRLAQKPVLLQLKIDTGMHRNGIMPNEIDEALRLLSTNPNLQVIGVFSHFADADTHNSELTKKTNSIVE